MVTVASSISSRIELLSKENYDTWSMQVEALLTKNDLWDFVNGSNPQTKSTIEKDEWLKLDKKAKADLILSIHPSELKQIRGCETSRDVWIKLESIYASKGPARKATLLKQLMLQRLDDGCDVKEHMAKFFDAVDKLESMNVQINGDLLAIMLLYSLPSSYENFRCAIESRDDLPTAEVLKVKIIEETEARKQASGSVVTAMAIGNRNNVRQDRSKRGKEIGFSKNVNIRCFKCGTLGHKANVCPNKKSKEISSNQRKLKQPVDERNESYTVSHTVTTSINNIFSAKATSTSKAWILDSGCTAHLCGDENFFKFIDESSKVKVNLANKAFAEVKGKGVVHISVGSNHGDRLIEFKDTLYVPDLRTNLISVAKITNKGHEVTFRKDDAYIRDERGNEFVIADRRGDLYYVRENTDCAKATVQSKCSELLKWHERLGHLNAKDLMKLAHNRVIPAFKLKDVDQISRCDVCLKGKMTASPFPKGRLPCTEILKIIHSDVVGPFRTESLGRAKYFVIFIDDSTRYCEVYFLTQKAGVFETFKLYQKLVEKQTGKKIKYLQSDNGREYCNVDFDRYLEDQGIERRLTIPHTPQQNGVAERMNRTLLDIARCLLLQSGLSASFWTEAVATACHIRNRCPTSSLKGSIPYEKWTGKKLKINYLRIFGSKVFVLNKDPCKDKFAQRSVEGIFVGYSRDSKGYRVWIPCKRQIIRARDVKFLEEIQKSCNDMHVLDQLCKEAHEGKNISSIVDKFYPEHSPELSSELSQINEVSMKQSPVPMTDLHSKEEQRAPGRPRMLRTGNRGRPRKLFHTTRSTTRVEDDVQINKDDSDIENDVHVNIAEVNIQDALNGKNCDEWKNAIESEMISLLKNDTWEIIKKDNVKDVVGCRLVLTNKHDPHGKIEKRKARLVAKGYSQKYGVNYYQTFAPVARLESLRLLFALAVQFDFKVWQFDVVTAYLNGFLKEEVYMKVPEMLNEMLERILIKQKETTEFGVRVKRMLNMLRSGGNVCRLKRSLYGLRQSGRQWYSRLSEKLMNLGLKPMKNEPCLFSSNANENLLLVLVYVDDILVASQKMECIIDLKRGLLEDFEIKCLGLAKYCLGIEIDQGEGYVKLCQTGYILGLLKQYGMDKCNPVATPSEVNLRFDGASQCDSREHFPYRELIGAIMYLSVVTRPDIANTVSRLAQFVTEPRKCHWLAAKRILRYLAGTADIGLVYTKTKMPLIGYTDADWGNCVIDRRSYTGYVFLLSGAAITWKSQKQRTVALSSTEAEYISLSEGAKEALYLRSVLHELGLHYWTNITIHVDNQGAQYLANDPVFHARTKHIDIRYHFIRESISTGMFTLKHVSTQDMIADVLTKSLTRFNHNKCLEGLGLVKNKTKKK